jgi:hypothetical protein
MKTLRLAFLALCLLTALILSGSDDLLAVANQKVESITNGEAPSGSTIQLSTAEVNALQLGRMREDGIEGEGVKDAKIVLGEDSGSWSGIVDFGKLPQLESLRNNFLLSSLLKTPKPVSAAMTLVSSAGKATLDVTQVTIGETQFTGNTLGFLVKQLVLNDYPEAKLGEPFDLEHNVESIKLKPEGVTIKMK